MSARVHAMLLAFLLAIVVGEPLRQHECAMHLGAVATSSPDGGKDWPGAHEHGAPAMHDHASARSGSADGESPEQDEHSCDCLGTCSVVAGVRLASVAELPAAVVTLAEPELPFALEIPAAIRPARLLPFANGPPTPA